VQWVHEKGNRAVSTSVGQPNPVSSWKQEVSLRIAAHQRRRGVASNLPAAPVQSRHASGSRAAEAAARVAARYAQAPSYSQILQTEAQALPRRVAVDCPPEAKAEAVVEAAELSAAAALEIAAPVLAQAALAPESTSEPTREPETPPAAAPTSSIAWNWEPDAPLDAPRIKLVAPESLEAWENESKRIHWVPDLRLLPLNPAIAVAPRRVEEMAPFIEEGWQTPSPKPELVERSWRLEESLEESLERGLEELEPVEPMQSIHANLIEFPRELVAARKIRPRRVEGAFALLSQEKQLSIFEVDPEAISTEPDATGEALAAAREETDWRGIELEPQAREEEAEVQQTPAESLAPELASVSRRLTAVLVDGAIVGAVGLGSVLVAAPGLLHQKPTRIVEFCAAGALLLVGLLYQTLFLMLAGATPGMRATSLSLCTFDEQIPTGSQVRSRLGAMLLSVAPLGLGVAWALFDDDRLCWHDRLSRTYLRRG